MSVKTNIWWNFSKLLLPQTTTNFLLSNETLKPILVLYCVRKVRTNVDMLHNGTQNQRRALSVPMLITIKKKIKDLPVSFLFHHSLF
jgi:hypothetical protein